MGIIGPLTETGKDEESNLPGTPLPLPNSSSCSEDIKIPMESSLEEQEEQSADELEDSTGGLPCFKTPQVAKNR